MKNEKKRKCLTEECTIGWICVCERESERAFESRSLEWNLVGGTMYIDSRKKENCWGEVIDEWRKKKLLKLWGWRLDIH